MAWQKLGWTVNKIECDPNDAFETLYVPGAQPLYSGIYRCEGCEVEVVGEKTRNLPTTHSSVVQDHEIRWRLIVAPNEHPWNSEFSSALTARKE